MADPVATNPDADGLVGAITAYAGETLPGPKYRWCHGTQTLLRTEFSLLFSRLGERWGVGDGSTTFGLPDLNARFLAGFDESAAAYDTVGESGGSATGGVSGTTGAGSAHSHGPGSYSVTTVSLVTAPGPAGGVPGAGTFPVAGTSGTESAHTHTFSGTADTIPPYKVVRYIIKIA
jgi:microcystin-dependent protein